MTIEKEFKSHPRLQHAIVIGGSLAGMLSARVLSEYFERVTIIERDLLPDSPGQRKGVPQARHLHALLLRGLQIVEELFPGIRSQMVEAGAVEIDTARDLAWLTPAGWGRRFGSDFIGLSFSRNLLDWMIRKRMRSIANIEIVENSDVMGLLSAGDRIVTGIRLARRGVTGASVLETMQADLVVDASGRNSRAGDWLVEIGCPRPEEKVVNSFLGYASRIYRIPQGFRADWSGVFLQASPPDQPRTGILLPIEGDRWMVTVSGGGRDYPPIEEHGFIEFIRSLPSQFIYDSIKAAEPISPVVGYRSTENRRRHFEKLSRIPDGLVITGDAVCAFNPVYGQGMTTAAMGALLLEDCLNNQLARSPRSPLSGLGTIFQKKLAKLNEAPWLLATGEDCRYRGTIGGQRNFKTKLMHGYVDRVIAMTTRSESGRRMWLRVFHMLSGPELLFHPSVVLKVLIGLFRRPSGQAFVKKDSNSSTRTLRPGSTGELKTQAS